MIVTAGHNIEGYEIVEYLDVLTAEYAFRTTYLKGFFSKDAFTVINAAGYYDKSHKGFLCNHIPKLIKGLRYQAESIGANGIISMSLQISEITNDFVIIFCTGTAVKIQKKLSSDTPNNSVNAKGITDERKKFNNAQDLKNYYSK